MSAVRMMSLVGMGALALSLAFSPSNAMAAQGGPAAAGEGVKRIAVVNVSRVFDAYTKVKDVQTKITNDFKPKQTELESRQRKLQEKQDAIRARSSQASPKDMALFREVQEAQAEEFELKIKVSEMAEDIEKAKLAEMKQVLLDIRNAIKEISMLEGYDLVMRAPEFDALAAAPTAPGQEDTTPKSAGELVRQFRDNPVLYFSEGVDLTAKVVAMLNKSYKPATGGAAAPAPAPKAGK